MQLPYSLARAPSNVFHVPCEQIRDNGLRKAYCLAYFDLLHPVAKEV